MDALKYITPKFFHHHQGLFQGTVHQGPDCRSYRGYHCPAPCSIALAIASGVNPEQGLYTAVVAGFFISFLGGQSGSDWWTDCSIRCYHLWHHCPVWYGWLDPCHAHGGTYAYYHGAPSFGDLIKFIPKTITLGFTLGIAVGIVAGQIKDFLGLEMSPCQLSFWKR